MVRKLFQWAVSFVLLGLGFLYLLTAGRYFFFNAPFFNTTAGSADVLSFRDAGVSLSISVALFGLGAINFWIFGEDDSPSDLISGEDAAVEK